MMNDRELADAIVACGVGFHESIPRSTTSVYRGHAFVDEGNIKHLMLSGEFVRDWRVAGAMMEKCEADGWDALIDLQAGCQPRVRLGRWQGESCSTENTKGIGKSESLPRAINEACIEALDES